jgi:uncharacterized protein YyaL (SSP411 family)
VAGLNVLTARGPEPGVEQRERIRMALYEARAERVRPGLDDKRLAAWNGLAIQAFAEAGAVLGREDFVATAVAAGEFVVGSMRDGDGRLLRTWKDGQGKLNAYLEDHAFLLEAFLALYEATFDPRWFEESVPLAEAILERFGAEDGGFYSTSSDHEQLVVRRRDIEDAPIPSGSSSAAVGLLRLAALTGEARYEEAAVSHLRLVAPFLGRHPQAFSHALLALDLVVRPGREVALAGDDVTALATVVRERLRPGVVLAGPAPEPSSATIPPLLEGRTPVGGAPAAYVCEHFACQLPVTDADALRELLEPAA